LAGNTVLVYSDGFVDTQNDPRLGLLPARWRMRFGREDDLHDDEYDDARLMRRLWFKNPEKRKVTMEDLRLTSEALKSIGVNVQDFIFV
jgi:hypothetical protein